MPILIRQSGLHTAKKIRLTDRIAKRASGIPTPSPIARFLFVEDAEDVEEEAGVGVLSGSSFKLAGSVAIAPTAAWLGEEDGVAWTWAWGRRKVREWDVGHPQCQYCI